MSIQPTDQSATPLRAQVTRLAAENAELWRLGTAELTARMTELEDLRRMCEAQQVAVAQEALDRGLTGASAPSSLAQGGVKAWVGHRFDECSIGGPVEPGRIALIASVATELAPAAAADGQGVLADAVRSGEVPLRAAKVCIGEVDRLRDLLVEGAEPAVWAGYTTLASQHSVRVVGALRESMLAQFGHADRIERDHATARRHAALTHATRDGALRKYRLTLGAEQAAQFEAAIGALSAPQPEADGSPDRRSAALRRAEALMSVLGRGQAAAAQVPGPTKAAIFVSIDWEALRSQQGAGVVVGSVEDGTVLPASTIARLACDAWILPAVVDREGRVGPLGAVTGASGDWISSDGTPLSGLSRVPGEPGSVLDVGRAERLFTLHQKRALILRDRHCTFPGCTTPATWCDAHHLKHWLDGGRSDLTNAALLCGRHHTIVHTRRLAGRLDPRSRTVVWDLVPDSYDRVLLGRPERP